MKLNKILMYIKYILLYLLLKTVGKVSYWKTKLLYGYGDEKTAPLLYLIGNAVFDIGYNLKIKRYRTV